MAGPAMMFATLKPRPQGWDKKSLEELTQKWREVCYFGIACAAVTSAWPNCWLPPRLFATSCSLPCSC